MDNIDNGVRYGTVYTWHQDKKLTISRISKARSVTKCGETAIMLSASYLGHMTLEEFQGPSSPES